MEEYKVSFVSEDTWDITYNGTRYGVWYDFYCGYYRLMLDKRNLGIFTALYPDSENYEGDRQAFVFSVEFKEGFITERLHEALEKYKIKPYYARHGNEYVDEEGNYVRAIGGETAFYRNGRYWYIKIGNNGLPEVEKSFFTQKGIIDYLDIMKEDLPMIKGKAKEKLIKFPKLSELISKKAVNLGLLSGLAVILGFIAIKFFKKGKKQ